MRNFLVIRLSSMGDVLLTIPVIKSILNANSDIQLLLVTRIRFIPYFDRIERLVIIPFDPEGGHKGLPGLFRLYREIKKFPFQGVLDLHGIIRTYLLDILFWISGHRIYRVGKHRAVRRAVIKRRATHEKVPHATERYLKVFEKAGLKGEIAHYPTASQTNTRPITKTGHQKIRIGMAPISKHYTKNWGLKNFNELIKLVRERYSPEIHLFGGIENQVYLNTLAGNDVINHAGYSDPSMETSTLASMDVFISMDSANMHLATLAGIPTISIWGATDPTLGFAPLFQPDDYALRADPAEITCRPCSVYGEIPCRRKDAPMICMETIRPEQVFKKISEILGPGGK